jgi:pectate lyase
VKLFGDIQKKNMIISRHILVIAFLLVWHFYSPARLVGGDNPYAFPGAMGWGAETSGGHGGQIIRVTNLDYDGPGSFKEAVETPGPRIVVFEVGGVIDLETQHISIQEPYITIAGQTAPSPGITFIRGELRVRTHDVIVQHIKVRVGEAGFEKMSGWNKDGMMTMGPGAYNIIIDHCSFTWGTDENLSASGGPTEGETPEEWQKNMSHYITFSNNIIAEGLSNSTHSEGEHSKGTLLAKNSTHIAVLRNLYAHNNQRNPRIARGVWAAVVNNFIYNYGNRAIELFARPEVDGLPPPIGKSAIIGNYGKQGPSTQESMGLIRINSGPEDGILETYIKDNVLYTPDGSPGEVLSISSNFEGKIIEMESPSIWHESIEVLPVDDVEEYIVINVGARPWDRDPIDKRIINEAITGTGAIIDSENDREGYPKHEPTYKTFDPNEWDLRYMISHAGYWPAPELISPENDAMNGGENLIFEWEAEQHFTHFTLQIATDHEFSSIVINETNITEGSFTINSLNNNGAYYWRIRGFNNTGPSKWSDVRRFGTSGEQSYHVIRLDAGWNQISSYILPQNSQMENIFANLIGNVILVKNDKTGVFWPDIGVDEIGDWLYDQGYQVFVKEDDVLIINGYDLQPQHTPINMSEGWNHIAYLRNSPIGVEVAFSLIIDKIVIVMNNHGEVFWPEYDIDTIGNLNPGEGYMIYLSAPATLTYPPNE